jgi:membrane-bound serine protease (ClpP class)
MLAGCVTAYMRYGTGGGTVALVSALLLALLALYIEFRVLPKTAIGRRVFLTSEIKSSSSPLGEEARDLIGKSATSLTMLSPSGYVSVDGKRYEAFCQTGQVPAGTLLDVISADNFRIIVSETKTN